MGLKEINHSLVGIKYNFVKLIVKIKQYFLNYIDVNLVKTMFPNQNFENTTYTNKTTNLARSLRCLTLYLL